MQYNTSRELLTIKEYGRGIHNMVKHLLTIEDKDKRQQNAEAVIETMALLNPQIKSIEEYQNKLWDHLFLLSNYELDVESPYPIPVQSDKQRKPDPLGYPKSKIKWTHFGKKFESLYNRAIEETDEEKQKGYIAVLALFMRYAYNTWHGEVVHEDMIKDELLQMSKGKLVYDPSVRFKEVVGTNIEGIIQASQKDKPSKKFKFQNNRGKQSNQNQSNNTNNQNRNKKFKFKKKNGVG